MVDQQPFHAGAARLPGIALAGLLAALSIAAADPGQAGGRGNGAERQGQAAKRRWVKLGDAPADLAGREMPPGMDGAWCFVPELNGFLLYGGCSPRYTNEGWLFDPVKRTWRLLWPDDSLRYDSAKRSWQVKAPREIVWSSDRPGPAKGQGMVYDPVKRLVYLFGGFPGDRREWFGGSKLGTWALDPRRLTFRYISADGPQGLTRGVYDSTSRRIIAIPQRPRRKGQQPVTWVFDPATETWEARRCDPTPRPGPHPAFSFDARIGQSVYFTEYGETWTYNSRENRWTNCKPSVSPPPRRHAGFCFDASIGRSILHGGVHHVKDDGIPWSRDSYGAFRLRADFGVQYNDTWSYDAVRNQWELLELKHGPPKTASARGCFAYDSVRNACVLYDLAVGFWTLGAADSDLPSTRSDVATVVDQRVIEAQEALNRRPIPLSREARSWQAGLRALPDDSWLSTQLRKPTQGCLNFEYDPVNRCLFWAGGCNGALFSTYEDYSYTNQVMILDMDVGRWFQRRANHTWGPVGAEYTNVRAGNGCGRAFCYDSTRKAIWTLGGVTSVGFAGTRGLQTYDVATDRFSVAGPGVRGFGANCGLVHDPGRDVLVAAAGQYGDIRATSIYDVRTGKWRRDAPHPPKYSLYSRIVFDRRIGAILITMLPTEWKMGDGDAEKPTDDLSRYTMRTFAYDVEHGTWRDLKPKHERQVAVSDLPGIAYDSRNRAVVLVENLAREAGYLAPRRSRQVWILDLDRNVWRKGRPTPPMQAINKCSIVYDANHNVVICGERSRIYLYRLRGGCPDDAFASR